MNISISLLSKPAGLIYQLLKLSGEFVESYFVAEIDPGSTIL
ncbi:MAG: hypothetical protein WB586_10610 [Chthoniobacterales bacterium]